MTPQLNSHSGSRYSLEVGCDFHNVREAALKVRAFLAKAGLSRQELGAWELIITEAGNNAVEYVSKNGKHRPISIRITMEDGTTELRVIDHTPGFDLPSHAELPEPDSEGGRGLFLIRNLADETRYIRGRDENSLVVRKRHCDDSIPAPDSSLTLGQPQRFTIDGDKQLEKRLAAVCQKVAVGVQGIVSRRNLEGVLLGGGYGRGEGGVLRDATADLPYNDLEFYVFISGPCAINERRYKTSLHSLADQLTVDVGIDVEFKILSTRKLRRSPPSMFYYDLVMGHRWIVGDELLLTGCEHHRKASQIPLHEATRLLMNRCSGLLFSLERLQRKTFTMVESDYVARNLAKARLALGDVLLTAHGLYHWSCRERANRLQHMNADLPSDKVASIKKQYAAAVEFKLHPFRSPQSREQLLAEHSELTAMARFLWLWLEKHRLKQPFASTREYAFSSVDKCPETSSIHNRLISLKRLNPRSALSFKPCRHPRQRLLQALSLLLWEPDPLHDGEVINRLRDDLNTSSSDFAGWVAAYERLWRHFN